MSINEYSKRKREELVAVANAMLNDKINLIEGVRKICSLRHLINDPENDVFMPLRAIDSETDHFPIGKLRENCADDYLQRVDNEMKRYLEESKHDILAACKEIVSAFS